MKHYIANQSIFKTPLLLVALTLLALVALSVGTGGIVQAATTITVANLNDSGAESLRQAIIDANPGDIIDFDPSILPGTIILTTGELSISTDLTIDGPGANELAVDGNDASRVFNISGGIVNISGVTIQNGNTDLDGAGLRNDGGTVSLEDTSVIDNTSIRGAGIYNKNGSLDITGGTISGNVATDGTESDEHEVGGGLMNDGGTVDLTSTNVSDNSALRGAGIYNIDGPLTVIDSTIDSNVTSGGSGGGIFNVNGGTLVMTGSLVTGNDSPIVGGGVYNTQANAEISDTTISHNHAANGGGAWNNGLTMTLTNVEVIDNTGDLGAGVFNWDGTVDLDMVTVSGNVADTNGGGIFNNELAATTISNSTISGNEAESGGGIFNDGGELTLTEVTVTENTVEDDGGAIAQILGITNVNSSTISNNNADDGKAGSFNSNGGGIDISGGILNITDSLLSDNTSSAFGGGVRVSSFDTITITNSVISGNEASTSGGGIWNNRIGTMVIIDSQISGNTADSVGNHGGITVGGGGIYNRGDLTLTNTTVSNNNVPLEDGGAGILNDGGELKIDSSTFVENAAGFEGGGIYNFSDFDTNGVVEVVDSTFVENTARFGGAIYNEGGEVTVINSSIIDGSVLNDGGGISNTRGGMLELINVTVAHNDAVANGGGIFNGFDATAVITNSTIIDNTSQSGGGIRSNGDLTMNSSTVSRNSAQQGGGFRFQGTATINNSTISGNIATATGGGIHGHATLGLNNVTISNNTADIGGGVFNLAPPAFIIESQNSIIAGNFGLSSSPDCDGALNSLGHNLIEDTTGCNISGDTTGNITEVDPMLGPLQDNGGPTHTHALLLDSPAIDMGDDGSAPATDQRGLGRPQGPASDIGAFELGPEPQFINDLLHLDDLTTDYDPDDNRAPGGVFTVTATFNNISPTSIFGLFFEVTSLGNGNSLLNATEGDGGIGSVVDAGNVAPAETFTAVFELGLSDRTPFQFFVDAFGIP